MKPRSSSRRSAPDRFRATDALGGSLLLGSFLTLCVLLGGSSSGGMLANTVLQLLSSILLGYSVLRLGRTPLSRPAKTLIAILLCWIAWAAVQLIPLPPSLWTMAPGRDLLEQRLAAGGVALPWLPLSLSPGGTLVHLGALLPPLAMGAAILSRAPAEAAILRWVIPVLALTSLLIGVAQLMGGQDSRLYLYAVTNRDLPVGLMANANHQATLMLCAIPFVAALSGTANNSGSKVRGRDLLLCAMVAMLLIGVLICQSYAAYILSIPVLFASWLIARPRSLGPARYIGTGIALLTVGALALVMVAGPAIFPDPAEHAVQLSRPAMYAVTTKAISHFVPLGSGLGSFQPAYRLFENPAQVTNVFVNHTHSDYLELALEGGVPGLFLIACLLLWWLRRAAGIWLARTSSRIDRAAVVATAAILCHSLVDYPARTSAIAAILGAGLALMIPRLAEVKPEEGQTGGRHLKAE